MTVPTGNRLGTPRRHIPSVSQMLEAELAKVLEECCVNAPVEPQGHNTPLIHFGAASEFCCYCDKHRTGAMTPVRCCRWGDDPSLTSTGLG